MVPRYKIACWYLWEKSSMVRERVKLFAKYPANLLTDWLLLNVHWPVFQLCTRWPCLSKGKLNYEREKQGCFLQNIPLSMGKIKCWNGNERIMIFGKISSLYLSEKPSSDRGWARIMFSAKYSAYLREKIACCQAKR